MVLYRFPFETKFYTALDTDGVPAISFFPFDAGRSLAFCGPMEEIQQTELPRFSPHRLSEINLTASESKADYLTTISETIDFVKEHQLPKLVISRRKKLYYQSVDLSATFLNLCEAYPNAFVYVFLKDGICWAGAFSEVLGKFNKKSGEFETMSLAGTLPVNLSWGEKEMEEQKPVTDFILKILRQYSGEVYQSATFDHISGNIKHLRTDFKAKIHPDQLDTLISELHPTPAVCGIPTPFCKNAIKTFEKKSREFYAGYIKVESGDHVFYFVNLRCAQFYKNGAELYVGGGITEKSNPQKEWQETELKAEAVLKNLATS